MPRHRGPNLRTPICVFVVTAFLIATVAHAEEAEVNEQTTGEEETAQAEESGAPEASAPSTSPPDEGSAPEASAPLTSPFENTRQACEDGQDNDGDGLVDCADSDCTPLVICAQHYTGENTSAACQDGVDNDGDGSVDCVDMECHDFISCSSPQSAQAPPAPAAQPVNAPLDQYSQYQQQRMQLRLEARERQLQNRLNSRLFITPMLQFWLIPVPDMGGIMSIGAGGSLAYRKHFSSRLGIHAAMGVTGGGYDIQISADEDTDDDFEGTFVNLTLLAAPVFGPFGRFYISPVLWFRQIWLRGELTETYTDGSETRVIAVSPSISCIGSGLDIGVFLGQRGQVDLSFPIHIGASDFSDPKLYVTIGISVGYGISFTRSSP